MEGVIRAADTVALLVTRSATNMPFWNVRRGRSAGATDGSAAREVQAHLEPIRLFRATDTVDGWLVVGGERVTDLLNLRESLRICTDARSDTWATVEREDLLLVAPPPLGAPTGRAIHRHKRRVMASVGPYTVEGIVHLPPGLPLDPFLLRTRQHFMPMTNAIVTATARAHEPGETYPVVVLNVHNLTELRLLVTLA